MDNKNTQNNLLILSVKDNIGIARSNLAQNTTVNADDKTFNLQQDIPLGHKIATQNIKQGDKIIKCGISIGSATQDIPQGAQLHLHNVKSDYIPTYTR